MPPRDSAPRTLCVDVGGSSVKAMLLLPDGTVLAERERIAVTYPCAPEQLVGYLTRLGRDLGPAQRVSIGFPGMVRDGSVLSAPHFVTVAGPGSDPDPALVGSWERFALGPAVEAALGVPVRVGNDADVQGLSVVAGTGLELVLTLGTGLGSALFHDGQLAPHLELAHHPFRKGETYNEQLGEAARLRVGHHAWVRRVAKAVARLRALTFPDAVYLGGGNAARLGDGAPAGVHVVDNVNGILGGLRLWEQDRIH